MWAIDKHGIPVPYQRDQYGNEVDERGYFREAVEEWGALGIYPPPLIGSAKNPETVQRVREDRARWSAMSEEDQREHLRRREEFVRRWDEEHSEYAAILDRPDDTDMRDQPVKLWLDDIREPPDATWSWVKTVDQAISLMQTGAVVEASLDHDLGTDEMGANLPEGRKLVYWMAEHDCWPSESISVHSANVVGVDYMLGMIDRYSPLERVGNSTRFVKTS